MVDKRSMVLIMMLSAYAQAAPAVWVQPALVRIGQNDTPGTTSQAAIKAARNEYESFQVAIQGAFSSGNVTVSDLSGPGTISKSNITLYRENFVNISPSSADWDGLGNKPGPPGMYADGLIPFVDPGTGQPITSASILAAPFSAAAGVNQVIWVDVYVPTTATAGIYTGTLTVSSSLGTVNVPISLTVWNFTLPSKPVEKSSFLFWNSNSLADEQELLKNKLMPDSIQPVSNESSLMTGNGLNATGTREWSGADAGNCSMTAAPSVGTFQSDAAQHASGLFLYDYSADEITSCTSLFPTLQQWAQNMHSAGIDNLVTMPPTPALYDDGSGTGRSAVDIWVELPMAYNATNVTTVQNKGDQVWSYNTLVQDDYSPKWLIDYAPIDLRIQSGFINESLGMKGLLYWQVDMWTASLVPAYSPWTNPNTTGQWNTNNYAGEALLLYPGGPVGSSRDVPSMRLKQLRDGVEDYDYIEILKGLGQGAWAMQLIQSVGASWSNWTQNPTTFLSVRDQLGQKIDSLSGGGTFSPCDVSQDGFTTVVDVQYEVNAALGILTCSSLYDINKDTLCNVIDVQRVENAALGGACVSP